MSEDAYLLPETLGPWRNRIVGFELRAVDQFLANPFNFRIHTEFQKTAFDDTVADVGFLIPVVENIRTGHVVDGHMRIDRAMRAGVPSLPTILIDLSQDEEDKALSSIDGISAQAVVDAHKFEELRGRLSDVSAGMRALLDKMAETATVLHDGPGSRDSGDGDPNKTADRKATLDELWEKHQVRPGDIFIIEHGDIEHTLMCGDSLQPPDIDRLLDNDVPSLCLTDPPYGVQFDAGSQKAEGDIQGTLGEYLHFSRSWMEIWQKVAPRLVFTPGYKNALAFVVSVGLPKAMLAWVVPGHQVPGSVSYVSTWEPIFCYGDKWPKRRSTDVLNYPFATGVTQLLRSHPYPKALPLWEDLVESFTDPGDSIVDPFAGSGTTIHACGNKGRRAYAMEKDPRFCALILERMELAGAEITRT